MMFVCLDVLWAFSEEFRGGGGVAERGVPLVVQVQRPWPYLEHTCHLPLWSVIYVPDGSRVPATSLGLGLYVINKISIIASRRYMCRQGLAVDVAPFTRTMVSKTTTLSSGTTIKDHWVQGLLITSTVAEDHSFTEQGNLGSEISCLKAGSRRNCISIARLGSTTPNYPGDHRLSITSYTTTVVRAVGSQRQPEPCCALQLLFLLCWLQTMLLFAL